QNLCQTPSSNCSIPMPSSAGGVFPERGAFPPSTFGLHPPNELIWHAAKDFISAQLFRISANKPPHGTAFADVIARGQSRIVTPSTRPKTITNRSNPSCWRRVLSVPGVPALAAFETMPILLYVPAARTQPLGRECAVNLHGLAIASDGAVRRPFEMLLVSRFHIECRGAFHPLRFTRKFSIRRAAGRS